MEEVKKEECFAEFSGELKQAQKVGKNIQMTGKVQLKW